MNKLWTVGHLSVNKEYEKIHGLLFTHCLSEFYTRTLLFHYQTKQDYDYGLLNQRGLGLWIF